MYAKTCRTRALLANALWGSNIPVSWRKKEICEAIKTYKLKNLDYMHSRIFWPLVNYCLFSHNSNLNVKEFEKPGSPLKSQKGGVTMSKTERCDYCGQETCIENLA